MKNLLEKETCWENIWELWKTSDINLVHLFSPQLQQWRCGNDALTAPLVFEVYNFSVSLAYIFRLEQSDSISLGQRQEYIKLFQ